MKTPLYVALQKVEVENPLLPWVILTLFRMGFLGAAQGWGGGGGWPKGTLSLKSVAHILQL